MFESLLLRTDGNRKRARKNIGSNHVVWGKENFYSYNSKSVKKLLVIFFGSLVFAFLPVIIAVTLASLGLIDATSRPGQMNTAEGIFVFMFATLPIGLLVAIVYATRIVVRFFKGE